MQVEDYVEHLPFHQSLDVNMNYGHSSNCMRKVHQYGRWIIITKTNPNDY